MLAIITAISNRFPSYIYLGKLKTNYSTLFYAERQSVLPTTIHHIPGKYLVVKISVHYNFFYTFLNIFLYILEHSKR